MNVIANYLAELVRAQLENRTPGPIPEGVSLEILSDISNRNHMDYMLLGGILKLEDIPMEYVEKFKVRVLRSVMLNANQVMEIKQFEKKSEEAKVVNLLMKGSCMKFMYPRPELREMSDIDVLIFNDCMDKADTVLNDMGYHLVKKVKHHDIYIKQPYMMIEAHRSMYDKNVDNNQFEYFSDFSRVKLKEGFQYGYELKIEDFYIYMMAHMAKHFYEMGCGIRNLVDIYVFMNRYGDELNREYLKAEFEKCGLTDFVAHMEELTNIWLNGESGNEFYDDLFQYMVDSGIYGKDENGIWNKFASESSNGCESNTFKLKMWYFFPPVYYMQKYYPWLEKKHWLLPVAWVIRGCRGVFFKKGKYKREMVMEIGPEKVKKYQTIYREMKLNFKG